MPIFLSGFASAYDEIVNAYAFDFKPVVIQHAGVCRASPLKPPILSARLSEPRIESPVPYSQPGVIDKELAKGRQRQGPFDLRTTCCCGPPWTAVRPAAAITLARRPQCAAWAAGALALCFGK